MTFREWLIDKNACEPAREWVGDRTLAQAWAECPRGDWMDWLFFEVAYDTNSWSEYDQLSHKWDELYWSSLDTSWRAAAAAPGFDLLKGRKILMGLMAAFFRSVRPTPPTIAGVSQLTSQEQTLTEIYEILVKEVGADPKTQTVSSSTTPSDPGSAARSAAAWELSHCTAPTELGIPTTPDSTCPPGKIHSSEQESKDLALAYDQAMKRGLRHLQTIAPKVGQEWTQWMGAYDQETVSRIRESGGRVSTPVGIEEEGKRHRALSELRR